MSPSRSVSVRPSLLQKDIQLERIAVLEKEMGVLEVENYELNNRNGELEGEKVEWGKEKEGFVFRIKEFERSELLENFEGGLGHFEDEGLV